MSEEWLSTREDTDLILVDRQPEGEEEYMDEEGLQEEDDNNGERAETGNKKKNGKTIEDQEREIEDEMKEYFEQLEEEDQRQAVRK